MEMEHINENTIRVVIGSDDLAARGITFLDLLGNHREIENFFYSILEEVDVEEEFKSSDAVTFQVLPKGENLELFISKNVDPDEFSPIEEIDIENDDLQDILTKRILGTEEVEDVPQFIFRFANFEDLIQLANDVYLDFAAANLYSFQQSYFLEIAFDEELITPEGVSDLTAQVLEYSYRTPVTAEVLAEYGHLIAERSALDLIRHYFD